MFSKVFEFLNAIINKFKVDFDKQLEADQTQDEKLSVRRTLFDKYNQFPQKKVMTFNKHTNDFDFRVNYGDLAHLKDP